jgi:type II secretory ATPase GspE/PulE/Tfp pilus assembly ATPase PilB-like protein
VISDRPFPAAVSVTLLEGRTVNGRIAQFSPYAPDLTLAVDDLSADGRARRMTLRGELIAYIAFKGALPGAASRPDTGLRAYKMHVVGGPPVSAEALPHDASNPLGFYGYPTDNEWDVSEYFFYAHGIQRREIDEPIGAMLIEDGSLDLAGLESGLSAQAQERKKTLGEILVDRERVARDEVEDALALQRRRKLRLGELLVEAGLVSQTEVDAALAEQRTRRGKRFGEVLMDMGLITEEVLMRTLSRKFELPLVDLDEQPIQPGALEQVPRTIVANLGVLPIYADARHVIVAIGDPLAFQAQDMLRAHCKKAIVEVLARPSQLKRHVERALFSGENGAHAPPDLAAILRDLAVENGSTPKEAETAETEPGESDGAVVRLVNRIIMDAYARGASDVHVEPNGKQREMSVRFRIDGECVAYHSVPASYRQAVVARIKIMAGLDISERRRPQDGKIRFRINHDKMIELRVATLPTVDDEDVVMRILADQKPLPLEKMGLSARNLEELHAAIRKPHGLVLCVGPTGSGKTTTLHSALSAINTPDMKICTAEDPVEISQAGLRQVQVMPKIGYTFAAAMRAFLRSDPDVIMVGEMRDQETAQTAVEASLTGHLVFSTLHTNSAPETLTRLLDMGLDPFAFSDALVAVLAQRLARALCAECKRSRTPTPTELAQIEAAYEANDARPPMSRRSAQVWHAVGCKSCEGCGYRGRVAVHELLVANEEIRRAIAQRTSVGAIRELAISGGMTTLVQDGVEKALAGITDLAQVMAVCSR